MNRDTMLISIALVFCLAMRLSAEPDSNKVTRYESIKPSELTPEMIGKSCTVFVHGEDYNRQEPQVSSTNETTYRGTIVSVGKTEISLLVVDSPSAANGSTRTVTVERERIRKLIIKTEQGAAANP